MNHITTDLTGKRPRIDFAFDLDGNLIATDLITNENIPVTEIKCRKPGSIRKWKIVNEKGKRRVMTQAEIDNSILRKTNSLRPKEELNLRNNVEATIYQLIYYYTGKKSRYRGLIKHRIWANARCTWINFGRVLRYLIKIIPQNTSTYPNNVMINENISVFNIFFGFFQSNIDFQNKKLPRNEIFKIFIPILRKCAILLDL